MQSDSRDDNTRSFVALTNGTSVGRYIIIEKIGAGGMGEVYLAEDTELQRKVALKFLPLHLCQDEDCRKRFKREAQAAAKLDHPNIVSVHEVTEFGGRPFIVMAHIEGRVLTEYAKEEKLSVNKIIDLALQLCEGIHAAHEQGVIHRDIKPSNVLIDASGRARIVDFGLASFHGTEPLTKTGSTLGTVGYMSPEQVRGDRIDQRSDLFSLGVVLYELLTGLNPFRGDSEVATSHAITHDSPQPLARYNRNIPDGLQRIVDKALEKDPSLRYQHADGMIADLRRLGRDSGVARRKRLGVWAAAVVVVLVAGIFFLTRPWVGRSSSQESEKIMLAILPFENLGEPENEYFADGITEEITSRLGMIRELGVISRTSAMRYKDTEKNLPQIAEELGVDYILEGTVRWDMAGDTKMVRITPQLIKTSENTHVWTDIYEDELTSIFQVQGNIASDIAAALDLTLLESVREAMGTQPTHSSDAYTAYLRGVEYDRLPGNEEGNFKRAILMFQRAIELDSSFALAWAGMSFVHSKYFVVFDRSDQRLTDARKTAEQSLELNPHLAEGHFALAAVHYNDWQYDSALIELDLAETYRPSLARIYNLRATVYEQKNGFTDESLKEVLRSEKLDPLDGFLLEQVAEEYYYRREIDRCMEYMDKAIALSPDASVGYGIKAYMLYNSGVDLDKARELLQHPIVREKGWSISHAAEVEIAAGNFSLALQLLDTCDYKRPNRADRSRWRRGWIRWLMGDTAVARAIYDSVRIQYESYLDGQDRSNERVYLTLAECWAILGDKEKAFQYIEKACEYRKHSYVGMLECREDRAKVFTIVGEYDRAVDELDIILSEKYYLGVPALKVLSTWNPLRDYPRFQALIKKYEKEYGI